MNYPVIRAHTPLGLKNRKSGKALPVSEAEP